MSDTSLVRSGDVEIDLSTRIVRRAGASTRIEPKAASVLHCLIEANGEVVRREYLLDHCWTVGGGSDEALVQVVGQLRRALDDDARRPRFIETVPKGGYRWAGFDPSTRPLDTGRRGTPGRASTRPSPGHIALALICLVAAIIVVVNVLPVSRPVPQVEVEATDGTTDGAPGRRYQIRGDPEAVQAEMRRLGLEK